MTDEEGHVDLIRLLGDLEVEVDLDVDGDVGTEGSVSDGERKGRRT